MTGIWFRNDRLHLVHTPEGVMGMADYNWEITGYTKALQRLMPEVRYGGNAYYVIGQMQLKGWKLEQHDACEMASEAAVQGIASEQAPGSDAALGAGEQPLPEPVEPDLPAEPLVQHHVPRVPPER
jgi:hypothetical protein